MPVVGSVGSNIGCVHYYYGTYNSTGSLGRALVTAAYFSLPVGV